MIWVFVFNEQQVSMSLKKNHIGLLLAILELLEKIIYRLPVFLF